MNCQPKCKTFLYIFGAKNRGQTIDYFEILSEVLIRLRSSWSHCKALARAHCLLYLVCVECIWFGKNLEKNRWPDTFGQGCIYICMYVCMYVFVYARFSTL